MNNRQEICNRIWWTFQLTEFKDKLGAIGYDTDREEVKILYTGGRIKRVNLEGQGDIEMISTIIKNL